MNLTLLDWAKRLDPDGTVPLLVNLLSQTNKILMDMVSVQGNLPTGHRTTIVTGLPTIYWRSLNDGVVPSKGTTVQVDEGAAIAEAWSEIDKKLADLNGNTAEFRLSESRLFIHGMNQTIASTMFYGNPAVNPDEFLGLSQRYSDPTAANGQNMIDGGGTGANAQTSVWLVCWGDNTVFAPFPKGSTAGLQQNNLGETTAYEVGGAGKRLRVYQEQFVWQIGLVVKDWRAAVRICNLETADFVALANEMDPSAAVGGYQDIIHLLIRAMGRIPEDVHAVSRPAFYMNRSVFTVMMRAAMEKSVNAVTIDPAATQFGKPNMELSFLGIPIRQCDAILNTEAVVTGF